MPTALAESLRTDRVGSLPLRAVCSVEPSASIEEVVKRLSQRGVGCALIADGRRLLGIFTERDFLSRVVAAGVDVRLPIERVMTPSPKTIDREASVQSAIELLESGGYRHLPVTGENGQVVGVLSVKNVMHYLVEYFPSKVYNLPPTPVQNQPAREGA